MESILLYGASALLGALLTAGWYRRRGSQPDTPAAPSANPDLIRISQVAAGYPLVWEIEGQRYWSLDEIEDTARRALAVAALRQLMYQLPPEFAGPLPPELAARPTTPHQPQQEAATPASPSAPRREPRPAAPAVAGEVRYDQPFWQRLKESLLEPPPASPARPALMPSGPTWMLDQIDELFQEHLRQLPDAPDAHVRPAPNGGMQIIVAGHVYRGVEMIPQPEVAAALREAVKRWEASV